MLGVQERLDHPYCGMAQGATPLYSPFARALRVGVKQDYGMA